MSAPGSTAPLLSVITPEMLPVVDCADAAAAHTATTSVARADQIGRMLICRLSHHDVGASRANVGGFTVFPAVACSRYGRNANVNRLVPAATVTYCLPFTE